jgi:hypothetical protein
MLHVSVDQIFAMLMSAPSSEGGVGHPSLSYLAGHRPAMIWGGVLY